MPMIADDVIIANSAVSISAIPSCGIPSIYTQIYIQTNLPGNIYMLILTPH